MLQWIRHCCQADATFPHERLSTVYYDTCDQKFLHEKINSDYLKTKVRIRWYTGYALSQQSDGVWLELKQKVGSQRQKRRFQLPYSGQTFAALPLQHPTLTISIPQILAARGIRFHAPIFPLFELVYERHRFFEPRSRMNVCVDCQLVVTKVNQQMCSAVSPVQIATAILEIKGKTPRVPDSLRPLLTMGCVRASISKYVLGYQHLFHEV